MQSKQVLLDRPKMIGDILRDGSNDFDKAVLAGGYKAARGVIKLRDGETPESVIRELRGHRPDDAPRQSMADFLAETDERTLIPMAQDEPCPDTACFTATRGGIEEINNAKLQARRDHLFGYGGFAPKPVIVGGQTCKWTHETDPDFDCWYPACNPDEAWSFDEEGPEANHFHFCPFCGKPIEVVEREPEKEDEDEDDEPQLCQCYCVCNRLATTTLDGMPVCQACTE